MIDGQRKDISDKIELLILTNMDTDQIYQQVSKDILGLQDDWQEIKSKFRISDEDKINEVLK